MKHIWQQVLKNFVPQYEMDYLKLASFAAAILWGIMSNSAFATNGYFAHGVGTKNKSMAGAGIALLEFASDSINNPAGAVLIGDAMDISLAVFSPSRNYQSSASLANGFGGAFSIGPNSLSSKNRFFPIPTFARIWKLNNNDAFAFAAYGRGGMNTEWENNGTASFDPTGLGGAPTTFSGTYGSGKTGIDMAQLTFNFTYSKKINEMISVGITPLFTIQHFRGNGLEAIARFTKTFNASNGAVFPTNLTNNNHDWSYGGGINFGVHAVPNEKISASIMYQTEQLMTDFDEYSDLFAESGGFNIPANLKAGLTFKPNNRLALSFDIERTWYGDIDSVGNSSSNLFNCPAVGGTDVESCLGGENGAGFGWENMTTYKFGMQWLSDNGWTWRAGYSHTSQPFDSKEVLFNILAPAVIMDHYTFGFTKTTRKGAWNFAAMFAPKENVRGINLFDTTQVINVDIYQFELELGYSWKY
jgi:long-chain fatty acid transport protein